jgi:dihydrofolate synthase/folylpolyglutamate synthase
MWTYEESLEWLYRRQALGIKLGLDKVERLLSALGDPQGTFHSIHVAGTNGKGSVCRMLAETLRRSGRRVGCTTSPHLVSFTERIEVDGQALARDEVARLLEHVRPHVEALDAQSQPPTFFEVVTAMAFTHFRDAGVEWAVVEAGMGGRLDATNVLEPELTVITNVDLDHQQHLGETVGLIAFEKAGIMKPRTPCVTAAKGEALRVLIGRSHEIGCPMSIIGADYRVVESPVGEGRGLVLLRPTGQSMYDVGLAGPHQRENAAIVVAAVEALRSYGVDIPERAVREGIRDVRHPGRLESFQLDAHSLAPGRIGAVQVLIDGAHNVAAARALRGHLDAIGWSGYHLITGFCADKDWAKAVAEWAPLATHTWAVPVCNPRSLAPAALRDEVRRRGWSATDAGSAASALNRAAAAGATRIVVAGSLFLAGEARAVLTGTSLEEIRGRQ